MTAHTKSANVLLFISRYSNGEHFQPLEEGEVEHVCMLILSECDLLRGMFLGVFN